MHKPNNHYVTHEPMTEHQILEKASEIIAAKFVGDELLNSTKASKDYAMMKLSCYQREVFAVMLLNSQHQLIEFKEVFFGTVDSASIYPREIVKEVLNNNASAVIFTHNHPSGTPTPSEADKCITKRLQDALALIDVRVLDHIVVGRTAFSFAEEGLLMG